MKEIKYLLSILMLTFCLTTIKAQEESKPPPEFTGYYFTDSKHKKITDKIPVTERYVFLVLQTLNAYGEFVTLNLDEDDGDFIYKNKFLNTKNSARFKIRKDSQKIKFIVYKESNKKHRRLRKEAEEKL